MKRKIVMTILTAAVLTFTACRADSNTNTSYSDEIIMDSVSPDRTDATYITVESGEDVTIDTAGTYVLSGTATDVMITVDAGDEDEVKLVLESLSVTNSDKAAIYVKNADKVYVSTESESSLEVTGQFDEDIAKADAVIYSKSDLVLTGSSALNIVSSDKGITSKDSINITGGKYTINAASDGLHTTETLVIDDGEIDIKAAEGIESTQIRINGGNITIDASDDGINASQKSDSYSVLFEMNGGYVKITMARGDTDGVDSNGDIVINGGIIDVTGQSCFDYDGTCEFNGGTVIVNGEETDTITNQFTHGIGDPGEFDPSNLPNDFDPDNHPEGFDPNNIPEGFDPGNRPDSLSGGNN